MLTFACFLPSTDDGCALNGLFTPVLILSTPAFNTTCVAAVYCTVAFGGVTSLGGTAAFSDTPDFSAALAGAEAVLDEPAPVTFGATGAFGAAAFVPETFARFPVGLAPASFFSFLHSFLTGLRARLQMGP
jgi:hypothetical protein